jgi:hypothetical protein
MCVRELQVAFPDRRTGRLTDACVFVPSQDLIHLVFGVKLKFLEALLFYFVCRSNVRLGLDFLNFLFQVRMLPGKRPELLINFEQMRFQFFILRVILHQGFSLLNSHAESGSEGWGKNLARWDDSA